MCRYNWHNAGSLSWPFPMLKYEYIKYTETFLSKSTRKLLWFEITKMLNAVLTYKFIVSFIIIFGTFVHGAVARAVCRAVGASRVR